MNKKFLVIAAASALLVSSMGVAAGCAKKSVATTETTQSVAVQVPEVSPVVQTEAEDPVVVAPVVFQKNPVMNFTGDYYNRKTEFMVEASGSENAMITVVLVNNNKTKTTLTVDAKFDPDTKTIEYTNGTKKTLTLDKDGNAVSEKVIYNNGTGKFVFGTSEAIWTDTNEKIKEMVFKFGEPEQISQQVKNTKIKVPVKKAKKTAKKAAKKPAKTPTKAPTNAPKKTFYTYGSTKYSFNGIVISVNLKKDNTASISIHVAKTDASNIRTELCWEASGKLDPETNIVTYKNCKKQLIIHTNTGTMVRDQYSGGSGEIRFRGGHSVTWTDNKEHYADGKKFKRA